jgi:hypothetical protein
MNKWRLPDFSLRDEAERAVSLQSRDTSALISASMLICAGNLTVTGELLPATAERFMPAALRQELLEIVVSDPSHALRLCAELGAPSSSDVGWRRALAVDRTFMSLAYELARGFMIVALYPDRRPVRRILKLSYRSYVVPATHDSWQVRLGHGLRWACAGAHDVTDSIAWRGRRRGERRHSSRIVFSTVCDPVAERIRTSGLSVACALAYVIGPDGTRRTMRLRPNSAVAFEHAPPGFYSIQLEARSGFTIIGKSNWEFRVADGATMRVEVHAEQGEIAKRPTLAMSLLARPASFMRSVSRGLGWHSKTLAIRVRIGDGGSYHCEFEAPEGLHVTRARLISNATLAEDNEGERELNLVSGSVQLAHLYAPSNLGDPTTSYAYFNIRPRIETLVRPALLTSWVAFVALLFIAITWTRGAGFRLHGPEDGSALLVLLLGAPTALVAYFSQAVPGRVSYAMLYGLRLFALLPALLTLTEGGVVLVGEHRSGGHLALWILAGMGLVLTLLLLVTRHYVLHPREQRARDLARGRPAERRRRGWATATGRGAGSSNSPAGQVDQESPSPSAIRDEMLERADGLSRATRRKLLSQPGRLRREYKVPPALYFDSAETPPTFVGIDSAREGVSSTVVAIVNGDLDAKINELDRALVADRAGSAGVGGRDGG